MSKTAWISMHCRGSGQRIGLIGGLLTGVASVALGQVASPGPGPDPDPGLGPADSGQQVPMSMVVEMTEQQRRAADIELVRGAGDKIVMVRWGTAKILLEQPVSECALAVTSAGKIIALAGGIRASLDLYFIDQAGGAKRYQTDGGRRMPPEFNGGHGSWPSVEGSHLVLFVFSKAGTPEFRALDFRGRSGRVQAGKTLSQKVESFAVTSNPDGAVTVRFQGVSELTAFRHPMAPRLEIKPSSLMQFGTVAAGSREDQLLRLVNVGARPLQIRIGQLPAGFTLAGRVKQRLAPGEQARVRIRFAPKRAGAVDARLEIRSTGFKRQHQIVLRGEVRAPRPAASDGKAATQPLRPRPQVPRVTTLRMYPKGDDRVLLVGQLATPGVARVVVRSPGGSEVIVPVNAKGRFHAHLAASVGHLLRLAAVATDARRSGLVELGQVPAMLRIVAGRALVRGLPEQPFLLMARAQGEVVRVWRGRMDRQGRRLVSLAVLGKASTEARASGLSLTVITEFEGVLATSRRVAVGPDNR